MRLGPLEMGLILVIILIVFGVGRLPQVGQALGKGIREFTRAKDGLEDKEGKTADSAPKDESKKKV